MNEFRKLMESLDTIVEGERDDAIAFIKNNHIAFEKGKNADAKFWTRPDPYVNGVNLVFYYLPSTNQVGADIVYLNDQDFESVDPMEAIEKYAPWELKDFIDENPDVEAAY